MKDSETEIDRGSASQGEQAQTPAKRVPFVRDLVILTLFFGVIFFVCFSQRELANPDEGRYAEIPREMLASGDWVTPRLDGVKYFEKPPFVYWMEAACIAVLGRSEASLRTPPAIFSLGGILLVYLVARKLYGRLAGLTAAAVLATSALYFFLSGLLILDMAVSVLITATLVCFILGVRTPKGTKRRWIFYALYASAALATLTKGLIGFLLPGAVMLLWLLVFNQWRRLLPIHLPSGTAIFLLVAAPWHVLAAMRNPEWAHFYFVQEHFERFLTTIHNRYEPWWFFVPVLIAGLVPWSGFVWPAMRSLLRGGIAGMREDADSWFFVVWAVFVFLFFSASDSKLIPYILPVFPPIAVLIGRWRALADNEADRGWRFALGGFVVSAVLLAAAMIYAVEKPGFIRNGTHHDLAVPYAYAVAAILVVGVVAVGFAARARRWSRAYGIILAVALASLGTLGWASPNFIDTDTRELARIVREQGKPDEPVFHYREFFHDFTYYSERLVGTVDYVGELELAIDAPARESGRFISDAEFRRQWAGPRRMWLVVRPRNAGPLFSDPAFHYFTLGESNGRILLSNQPTVSPECPP